MKLSQFKFNLPSNLIANYPAKNRDEARLMVVNRKDGSIEHRIFKDILDYVIEPLLNMEMNGYTKIILEDYIVNLGQPKKGLKETGRETGLETILAVSNKNKKIFSVSIKIPEDKEDTIDNKTIFFIFLFML